jgi:hypothetical protein
MTSYHTSRSSVITRDVEFEPVGASRLRRGWRRRRRRRRRKGQSAESLWGSAAPLRTTISNRSEPFFRNPTMGFVYKDMYYIEPILSLPKSSQASCILPRLYELSSLLVHLVAPPPLHTPLQVVHSSPSYFEARNEAWPIFIRQLMQTGISTPS